MSIIVADRFIEGLGSTIESGAGRAAAIGTE